MKMTTAIAVASMPERKPVEQFETSIYHLYLPHHRRIFLVTAALTALLTPFTDTIYLPALTSVSSSFNASDSLVALTVSIYLACVGIGQLFWGPLSDYYGRTVVLYVVLILYEGLTIGCIFANSIQTLIILRSFQGLFVGSTIIAAQALVSDVFPPDEIGEAIGAFLAPMLVGPILAPIVGGVLSQTFGWRATFVLLAIMTVPIFILIIFTVPETNHWHVVQRIEKKNAKKLSSSPFYEQEDNNNLQQQSSVSGTEYELVPQPSSQNDVEAGPQQVIEIVTDVSDQKDDKDISTKLYKSKIAEQVELVRKTHILNLSEKDSIIRPQLISPFEVLKFILEPDLAAYYVISCISFGLMFTSLTISPLMLAASPYNLSESIIGVTYIPVGIAMLLGPLVGGYLSDKAAEIDPTKPINRVAYSFFFLILEGLATIGFGYLLENGINLAAVLICQFILGFGQSVAMIILSSYFQSARPENRGSAGALMMFLCFGGAAVLVSISVEISNAIGVGNFFVIFVGLLFLATGWGFLSLKKLQ